MIRLPVYLDHHATTPVDPRVFEAMRPYFLERFGNAASRTHAFGWVAEEAVEVARRQIAELVGAAAREIVFTSGATESNNLALKGVVSQYARKGRHIVTSVSEHRSILDVCARLEKDGVEVSYVPVRTDGTTDPEAVRSALTDRTILVSLMLANNEVGSIQDIRTIGRMVRERGILMHSDLSQAAGKIPVNVDDLHLDLASLSGHKLYGPKGIGVLFVRRRAPRVVLTPQMDGGGHEQGLRSGTLNVPAIVGFGKAAELCVAEMEQDFRRQAALVRRLHQRLVERVPDLRVNGPWTSETQLAWPEAGRHAVRLPNNLNVSFEGVDADGMMVALKDVAVSSGSACTSAHPEPSHVLRAMSVPPELIRSSLRFGVGRFNTEEEIDFAADRVATVVTKLRTPLLSRGELNEHR